MVYLVDDDVDDLEIIQAALEQNNYKGTVRTAMDGKALMHDLEGASGSPIPKVIILDLNMPLMDGFQVLEEIKSHGNLNSIPVIVLTASRNKMDEIRCFELGCSFYFTKPDHLKEYEPIATMVKRLATATD